mgnify:FL=1
MSALHKVTGIGYINISQIVLVTDVICVDYEGCTPNDDDFDMDNCCYQFSVYCGVACHIVKSHYGDMDETIRKVIQERQDTLVNEYAKWHHKATSR